MHSFKIWSKASDNSDTQQIIHTTMFSFERIVESISRIAKDHGVHVRGSHDLYTSKIALSEDPPMILGNEVIGRYEEVLKASITRKTALPYRLKIADGAKESDEERDRRLRTLIIRVHDSIKRHDPVSK